VWRLKKIFTESSHCWGLFLIFVDEWEIKHWNAGRTLGKLTERRAELWKGGRILPVPAGVTRRSEEEWGREEAEKASEYMKWEWKHWRKCVGNRVRMRMKYWLIDLYRDVWPSVSWVAILPWRVAWQVIALESYLPLKFSHVFVQYYIGQTQGLTFILKFQIFHIDVWHFSALYRDIEALSFTSSCDYVRKDSAVAHASQKRATWFQNSSTC